MKDHKYIKVLSRGYVTTNRGRAFTPITRAFKECTKNIFTMITVDKATVVEVLSDGTEIKLTPQNFDKDNEPHVAQPVVQAKAPVVEESTPTDEWVPTGETTDNEWVRTDEAVDESEQDTGDAEVVDESDSEEATQDTTQPNQQYYNKKNRKNRHRNGNGAPQVNPETV